MEYDLLISKWTFDNKEIISTLLRRDNKSPYPKIRSKIIIIIYKVINKVSIILVLLVTQISSLINILETNSTKFFIMII